MDARSLPQVPTVDALLGGDVVAGIIALGVGELRVGGHVRRLYSTDASLYQVEPLGVIAPTDLDRVPELLRYCGERGVAVLPRGGGTSLAGQCTNRALVVDFTPHARRVVSVDVERRRCRVEPGIGIDDLNRVLEARGCGLFFAPDPATSAQASIGGCIGNNAAGARSIRYGRTSENVSGLDIVLADGRRTWLGKGAGSRCLVALELAERVAAVVNHDAEEIRARFPKLVRRNAGYALDLVLKQLDEGVKPADLDLTGLICGSEGTLAAVVGAELKLERVPERRGLAIACFGTLEEAIEAVRPILSTGPSAVELLDDTVLRAAAGNAGCRPYVELLPKVGGRAPAAALYVEYQVEERGGELGPRLEVLRRTVPGAAVETYEDPAAMAKAWTLRKSGEALLHGLPGARKPITFVEDNSVPVEQLVRFVREFKRIVASQGTVAAFWAHASVGVLHVRPMLDLHDGEDRVRMQRIAEEVAELARECGGVMSGEHGDGRVRGPLLERFYGPAMMGAFAAVKRVFDPRGILNPGNIVGAGPVESIAQNLRIDRERGAGRVNAVKTYFEYPGEEGFRGAVEGCNGAGFCRKLAGGMMCPSYRATLDERHSTRGRGNAIRLAVTGQAGEGAGPRWDDPGAIQTLDLCLSCKACKTECPSNVDIAQLKAEYTAQRYRQTGAPLRAKLIGHVRWMNRLASMAPGLANAAARWGPARRLMNRVMGLAAERELPRFGRSLFRMVERESGDGPRVVLFGDCFTAYGESQIGRAAVSLLRRLGYRVEVVNAGCCGRAMISAGLLRDAIAMADRALGKLRAAIEDEGVAAVLVLEPSCLSAMKDEWLALKLNTPRAVRERLAGKAMLVEEFVAKRWEDHPVRPRVAEDGGTGPVILHGHCHQKALWGAESSAAALRRVFGDRLRVLDSGCCGMAGAFGYAVEHYELSMKIGELSVFGPVRGAGRDAVIVAPGVSCRHQVRDGTGRTALHPVELLAMKLDRG